MEKVLVLITQLASFCQAPDPDLSLRATTGLVHKRPYELICADEAQGGHFSRGFWGKWILDSRRECILFLWLLAGAGVGYKLKAGIVPAIRKSSFQPKSEASLPEPAEQTSQGTSSWSRGYRSYFWGLLSWLVCCLVSHKSLPNVRREASVLRHLAEETFSDTIGRIKRKLERIPFLIQSHLMPCLSTK